MLKEKTSDSNDNCCQTSGRCSYGLVVLVVVAVADVALVDVVVEFWWFVDVPVGLVVLGGE